MIAESQQPDTKTPMPARTSGISVRDLSGETMVHLRCLENETEDESEAASTKNKWVSNWKNYNTLFDVHHNARTSRLPELTATAAFNGDGSQSEARPSDLVLPSDRQFESHPMQRGIVLGGGRSLPGNCQLA
jgi:hypothetical protein